MTEKQREKRYNILENITGSHRRNYDIRLTDSFIQIRNNKTYDGIFTDSLQAAKTWLKKDMKG